MVEISTPQMKQTSGSSISLLLLQISTGRVVNVLTKVTLIAVAEISLPRGLSARVSLSSKEKYSIGFTMRLTNKVLNSSLLSPAVSAKNVCKISPLGPLARSTLAVSFKNVQKRHTIEKSLVDGWRKIRNIS
jgi:hypothetical protein